MILDLEPIFNIDGASKNFDYTINLSSEELGNEKPFVKPVAVKGLVQNHAGIVELNADVDFEMNLPCDRCAKPIVLPLNMSFSHTLVTHINDESNDELLLVNELRFDLDELITEDIFLELPSKFLCSEDCKGVCSKCGKDLNDGPCGCKKEVDPRLAALQQLLDD